MTSARSDGNTEAMQENVHSNSAPRAAFNSLVTATTTSTSTTGAFGRFAGVTNVRDMLKCCRMTTKTHDGICQFIALVRFDPWFDIGAATQGCTG